MRKKERKNRDEEDKRGVSWEKTSGTCRTGPHCHGKVPTGKADGRCSGGPSLWGATILVRSSAQRALPLCYLIIFHASHCSVSHYYSSTSTRHLIQIHHSSAIHVSTTCNPHTTTLRDDENTNAVRQTRDSESPVHPSPQKRDSIETLQSTNLARMKVWAITPSG